jgi:vancomycin resistance protein VanJ
VRTWMRGAAPRSRLRAGRVVLTPIDGLGWLLALALGVVAFLYHTMGDRTWWGTALIYSGRWPWLLPVMAFALVALVLRRTALIPATVAALLVLGPIMGGELSTAPLWPHAERHLRVMTYNVENGNTVAFRLRELLAAERPDIAAFEECGSPMRAAVAGMQDWEVRDTSDAHSVCLLSRYPLRAPPTTMQAKDFRAAGGAAVAARYELVTPGGVVTLFVLHLETPRHGVQHLLTDPLRAPPLIEANNILRDTESRVVRRWVDSTSAPRIVVGDFNLPVESVIWQRYWRPGLEDAFEAAGNGWGYTRLNGWIRVRIDHVLLDPQLRATGAQLGSDWGSDHLPFIAEVTWK